MSKTTPPAQDSRGHASIEDAMVALLGDESIREDMRLESEKYVVLEQMLAARIGARLSQEEIAKAMGSSQSAVSRIENGTDASVSVMEMRTWFAACGMNVRIEVDAAGAAHISSEKILKTEVLRIKERLEALEALAVELGAGEDVMRSIEAFRSSALLNLLALAESPPKRTMAAEPDPSYKARKGRRKK